MDCAFLVQPKTVIALEDDLVVDEEIYIEQNCVISGNGHRVTFAPEGRIVIAAGVTMQLDDVMLEYSNAENIVFAGAMARLLVSSNATLQLWNNLDAGHGLVEFVRGATLVRVNKARIAGKTKGSRRVVMV